jgi:uncharacterized membrane-anchored protein
LKGIHIENVEIKHVEMTNERLAALVAIFVGGRATNSSNVVNFNNTNLCDEGIISLSKLVDACPHLYELQLNNKSDR